MLRRRARHQVHPRRRIRDPGDGGALRAHERIRRHYDRVRDELARRARATPSSQLLPRRVHAIVLVSKIHKPTLRALAYARATPARRSSRRSPSTSTPTRPGRCRPSGSRRDIPVPLKALDSPFREITRPVVDYVQVDPLAATRATSSSSTSPSTSSGTGGSSCCTTRARCGSRAGCCSRPGVMVASVPWQLASSAGRRGADGRPGRRRRPPRRGLMPAAPHGSGLAVGDEVEVDVTAGRPRRALRRPPRGPGRLRPAHAPRRAGASPGSPRPAPASAFLRADAVEVLERVARPGRRRRARAAGPGGCAAAATSQHVALPRQRALKADVVREQLRRLAHLDVDVEVEPVPGDDAAGSAGAPASSSPSTPRAGRACAGTARTTSCPIDHCRIAAAGDRPRSRVTERPLAGRRARSTPSRRRAASRSPSRVPAPASTCRSCASGSTRRWPARDGASSTRRLRVPRRRPAGSGRCTRAPPAPASRPCWRPRDARPGERALDLYAGVGPVHRAAGRRRGGDRAGGRRRGRRRGPPSTPARNLARPAQRRRAAPPGSTTPSGSRGRPAGGPRSSGGAARARRRAPR